METTVVLYVAVGVLLFLVFMYKRSLAKCTKDLNDCATVIQLIQPSLHDHVELLKVLVEVNNISDDMADEAIASSSDGKLHDSNLIHLKFILDRYRREHSK